ncbi:hypothetical protein ABFA07_006687 [Porites harrisoni]
MWKRLWKKKIAEKEVAAEDTVENDKKKLGNAKAVESINRALESLGRTQKWQRNEDEENAKRKQKSRRSGDTVAYLGEKNVLVQKWKEEELQLQKPRVEVEGKREDQSRKEHQHMMKILLEQTKQQQEQMQRSQQMFTSIQRQQSDIIMKLLERKNNLA